MEAILNFVEAILNFVEAILGFEEAILNLVKTKSTPRFDLDFEFDNTDLWPMTFFSSSRRRIFKIYIRIRMKGIQNLKKQIHFIRNQIPKLYRIIR